jgi:CxxC motif-containing protein (DUF1111 family)
LSNLASFSPFTDVADATCDVVTRSDATFETGVCHIPGSHDAIGRCEVVDGPLDVVMFHSQHVSHARRLNHDVQLMDGREITVDSSLLDFRSSNEIAPTVIQLDGDNKL